MSHTPNTQALLQQGLLPFLLQKMGVTAPFLGGHQAPSSPPAGTPTSTPQLTQAQGPKAPQQQPSAPASTPPGAGGGSQDLSRIGNYAAPTPQPIADVHSLQQLLVGWSSRKQQKQQAEASNAATSLMQAIEGAKTTGDWAPAYTILQENEALFNKVYKGWLQKSEKAQKPGKPPDPAQSGVEQGISQYMASKQAPKGPPPQGSAPSSLAGYFLPQAGPAQQAATTQARTAAITSQQDLEKAQRGEPTRAQQAEIDKYAAMRDKYHTEIQKEALGVQKASFESQKALTELQLKQAEASISKEKGKLSLDIEEKKLQVANVGLDIANARLKFTRLHPPGAAKMQQPPASFVTHLSAANQAEAYVESVLNSRGDKGFTKEDVQTLQGMLRQAGAASLASSLPGWMGRNAPAWLGGSGKADVQSLLDSIGDYKSGLTDTITSRYPEWGAKQGIKSGADDTSETTPDESDEPDADIIVSPEEMSKP
jgi:hypothetical protein